MSITVNTNMSSLICQRSLTKATSGMNTALQRMSTGLKINSAKDDAAGCAISSKMDYKLSSYGVAQDNAQMGQSMLDTASGSLSVMNGMLQRMRDLSEQAANGTYGKEERQAMQAEVDALTKELYRIKNTTDFNGKKVLGEEEQHEITSVPDISMSDININNIQAYKNKVIGISSAQELAKLTDIVNGTNGVTAQDTTDVTFALIGDIDLNDLGLDANGSNWTAVGNDALQFKGTFDGNGYTINNLKINTTKTTFTTADKYQGLFGRISGAIVKNVNLQDTEIHGLSYLGSLVGLNRDNSSVYNCSVENAIITGNTHTGGLVGENGVDSTVDSCYGTSNVTANQYSGALVGVCYHAPQPTNCAWDSIYNGAVTKEGIMPNKKDTPVININLQVGINADENSVISVATGFEMGDFKISLNTEGGARIALDKIDKMMAKVNAKQLDIGATSNRLASTMEFQSVQMSALTSANSLIKDADIAKESASYIKNQILQQTTATLLATANQNPSIALSLV